MSSAPDCLSIAPGKLARCEFLGRNTRRIDLLPKSTAVSSGPYTITALFLANRVITNCRSFEYNLFVNGRFPCTIPRQQHNTRHEEEIPHDNCPHADPGVPYHPA